MKNLARRLIGYSHASALIAFPCGLVAEEALRSQYTLSQTLQMWTGSMRLNALRNLDQFLDWTISEKHRAFPLVHPLQEKEIAVDILEVREFAEKYGYFSLLHPLVGKVSTSEKDLDLTCSLLKILYEKGAKGEYLEIATAEILTKVLAYRDLKIGKKIAIPVERGGRVSLESFIVDKIFNLWHGMPAFGLIPEREGMASLLLFRGTDFSFDSQRGWASMLSDLDIAGPGLFAFRRSQSALSEWLQKAMEMGKAAKVMGFSLGGAFAAYTFIYENRLVADRGSISVCGPGVAEEVVAEWKSLKRQQGLLSYVNAGDVVSKVGNLFGTVYCLSSSIPYKPLRAHTRLICSEPLFSKALVDTSQ